MQQSYELHNIQSRKKSYQTRMFDAIHNAQCTYAHVVGCIRCLFVTILRFVEISWIHVVKRANLHTRAIHVPS